MSLDTHGVKKVHGAENSIYYSSVNAFSDFVNNALGYNFVFLAPYYGGLISGGAALAVAAPVSIIYFAHRFNQYYNGDIQIAQYSISKVKKTEGDFKKSLYAAAPEALNDAVMIDGLTYFSLYSGAKIAVKVGLASATGPFAIPIQFVALGTVGALAGYTIRKTCNNYLNEGDHSVMCGIAGGVIKYSIKSNPLKLISLKASLKPELSVEQRTEILGEINIEKSNLFKNAIIGATNNGLYEYRGHDIGAVIKQNNTQSFIAKVHSIEHMDAVLAVSLKGEAYSPELIMSAAASGIIVWSVVSVPSLGSIYNSTMQLYNNTMESLAYYQAQAGFDLESVNQESQDEIVEDKVCLPERMQDYLFKGNVCLPEHNHDDLIDS